MQRGAGIRPAPLSAVSIVTRYSDGRYTPESGHGRRSPPRPFRADCVAEVGFAGRVQGRRYFWTQPRRWLCASPMAERRR